MDRHVAAGFLSPVSPQVRRLVSSAARKQRKRSKPKKAITAEQVVRVANLDLTGRAKDVRDRALFIVGFALSWRRSEMASLDLDDVEFSGRRLIVYLGASKTDQEGKGRTVKLPDGKNAATCPVRALRQWLAVRGDWRGPLFCSVNRIDTALTRQRISGQVVCDAVQNLLAAIGENETKYGAHSLRSGMITTAAENGASLASIQQRTGHRSIETLMSYIRPSEGFACDPLKGVL